MNYLVHEKKYLQMMHSFVQGAMDAQAFVPQFFDLRNKDVEKEGALRATWDKPYDQILIAALERGDISHDEFGRRWEELFGWSEREKQFLDMRGRVFTACDAFVDNPDLSTDPAHEYDAQQLRDFVAQELRAYEHFW